MKKEMVINAQRDESRIAIVADGLLSELYVERASSLSQVGNIYKGRVTNVEPSIQAAFVDFGKAKNGFLHISDLHPQHFPSGQTEVEAVGKKRARRDRPPIQNCLRRGDEVIVQVTKEGIGTKGATLTTYLSIPGRYLVLMPGMHRLGVSRKIEDESSRSHIRAILEELKPPPELGFIVRTAGMDRSKQDLQRDLHYLLRLWKAVEQRSAQARAPAELYQESDLVIRTIRDVYNTEVQRIVCDDEVVAGKVKEFLQLTMPRSAHRVELYTGKVGIFHAFGLEEEIERFGSPRVPLPSGGSLIIEQAEALVAIDVNSGRFRQTEDAESTAVRTNAEAAREVARQLRLRDMGGVIVIDFIDMVEERHRRQIEKTLRDAVAEDRAKTKILRISRFGIVEMTRQRVRPSLASSIFRPCSHCGGSGRVKSEESQALSVMRTLSLAANDSRVARIELTVPPPVANHILNQRRQDLLRLEQTSATRILVHADPLLPGGELRVALSDGRGTNIPWEQVSTAAAGASQAPARPITEADAARILRGRPGAEPAGAPVPPGPTELAAATPVEAAGTPAGPPSAGEPAVPAEPPSVGEPGLPAVEGRPVTPGKRRRHRRGGRGRSRRGPATAPAAQTAAVGGQPGTPAAVQPQQAPPAPAPPAQPPRETPVPSAAAPDLQTFPTQVPVPVPQPAGAQPAPRPAPPPAGQPHPRKSRRRRRRRPRRPVPGSAPQSAPPPAGGSP